MKVLIITILHFLEWKISPTSLFLSLLNQYSHCKETDLFSLGSVNHCVEEQRPSIKTTRKKKNASDYWSCNLLLHSSPQTTDALVIRCQAALPPHTTNSSPGPQHAKCSSSSPVLKSAIATLLLGCNRKHHTALGLLRMLRRMGNT